jgi:hypothetical protein
MIRGTLMLRSTFLPLLLLVPLLGAGCGDDDITTPTMPSETPPANVTDTFTGSINRNGAATHLFVALRAGSVQATLTTVSPDPAVVLGLSLGTWNGSACAIVLANDRAAQGASILGSATATGNLCVRIYDVGNVTDTVSYEVTVVHP